MLAILPDVGGPELLLIFFLVLVLFGGKRLPELARGLGKSVREFKRATAGVEQELKRVLEDEPAERRARAGIKNGEPGQTTAAIAATAATTAASGEPKAEEAEDTPDTDNYYDPTDDEFTADENQDSANHGSDDKASPYPELGGEGPGAGPAQPDGETATDGPPEKKNAPPPSPEAGDGGGI